MRQCRGLLWALLVLMATLSSAQAAEVSAAGLDAAVEREHVADRFDGVVLVGHGDQLVYQRAIGWADRLQQRPHVVDEVWRWASVSKQVAAVLAMQLVEQGKLSLDARLDTLLPAFKSAQATNISVRQLLQHTSGLPNPDDTAMDGHGELAVPAFYRARFQDGASAEQAALTFCAGPARAAPGSGFNYNNCDTWVLQAVLEKLTGTSYARLLAQQVALPLHLPHLAMAAPDGSVRGASTGYLPSGQAEPFINLASFGAGGAVIGTAQELWEFDRALMQGRLLGADALKTLWRGDPQLGYVALGAWSFPARLPGCKAALDLVERRGEIGGVQVRNLMAPALGAALIVFSNTAATDFGEIWQGRGLAHELADAAFCGKPAEEKAARQ
jgi:CubicO group peptidase (beta-lactamase class C family)